MTDVNWEDVTLDLAFGGRFEPEKFNLMIKPGKDIADVKAARYKAFETPPFKTESHLSRLEKSLRKLLVPAVVQVPKSTTTT